MPAFIHQFIRLFFLLTPFFGLSMYLHHCESLSSKEQRHLAQTTLLAILSISFILLLAGNSIFSLLGITLDAFRAGAGLLLMLSAIELVQDTTLNRHFGHYSSQ